MFSNSMCQTNLLNTLCIIYTYTHIMEIGAAEMDSALVHYAVKEG
jgi:hypothetical protein